MSKQLVFIDESGDAGLTGSQSCRFIIAAVVVVRENEDLEIRTKMNEYRQTLGWHKLDEFKFSRTRKAVVKELLNLLSTCKFKVYGVVLDKKKKIKKYQIDNRYSLYNYVLSELLKILPDGDLSICIDGEAGKKYQKNTLVFLRKQIGYKNKIIGFRYLSSKSCEELQLADLIVGSIGRSFSEHRDKDEYIRLLEDKIVKIKEL